MNPSQPDPKAPTGRSTDMAVIVLLAQLLQRLEQSREPMSAQQYRSVAQHLAREFEGVPMDAPLEKLLAAFPAAAQVYENATYEHAGLSRAPLDAAVAAELAAREAIAKAMQHTAGSR